MASYDKEIDYVNSEVYLKLKDRSIYGSSRVGVRSTDIDMLALHNPNYSMKSVKYEIGKRTYELSNHLGNVLSVISDKAIPSFEHEELAGMLADVRVAQDYSPFGVTLSGRSFEVDGGYRYGFQGQEKDDEVSGKGNSYTAEFWQYSPRLGQRWNIDPMTAKYPWQSPYATFNNNPLRFTDKFGLEGQDWIGKKDGKGGTNWEWDKNVKSPDQLPSGYTEYAKPGHTYSSGGENVKLGDNGKWNYTSSSITNQGLPIDNDYTEQKLEAQRFHEQNEGYSKFLQNGLTNYVFFVATLPVGFTRGVLSAGLSAGSNLIGQLGTNNFDIKKVDVASVGISAASGVIFKTTPVFNVLTTSALDASIDVTINGTHKTFLEKNYSELSIDFGVGIIGGALNNTTGQNSLPTGFKFTQSTFIELNVNALQSGFDKLNGVK
ncbi:MAG: hypothetical protein PHQ74_03805 [Crocinitomicaceae bacterium]|nr:hypothetical protein [Crocinitomicaceae bacterium]